MITVRSDAKFCSQKCGTYWRRKLKKLPRQLTTRDRWVRYDHDKRPLAIDGRPASSTDPRTWASHAEAVASSVGVGLGFVLGEGIGCIDIDHCITDGVIDARALQLVADTDHFYVEVSPSGEGLHIWHHAKEGRGTRRTENGLHVERYSVGRYITVTGRPI